MPTTDEAHLRSQPHLQWQLTPTHPLALSHRLFNLGTFAFAYATAVNGALIERPTTVSPATIPNWKNSLGAQGGEKCSRAPNHLD